MKVIKDTVKWAQGIGEWNNFAYFLAGGAVVYVAIWAFSKPVAVVAPVHSLRMIPAYSQTCPQCHGQDYVPRW